ncbi:MAG: hypothetical protein AB7O59_02670 [Pirellulales bacterium]
MEYQGQTFVDVREVVDGNRYVACTFLRCGIVYCGGGIPDIVGCNFDGCDWHFEEAAERTLAFLHYLYHGTGEPGRTMIEQTFELIRTAAAMDDDSDDEESDGDDEP